MLNPSQRKRIQLFVIGAGRMSQHRIPHFLNSKINSESGGIEIIPAAIISEYGITAKELAEKFQFKHHAALKDDHVQLAEKINNTNDEVIAFMSIPHQYQFDWIKWCAENLKQCHFIFVGGPLACTLQEGLSIFDLTKKRKITIECGYENNYNSLMDHVREILPQIGTISRISSNAQFPAQSGSWYYNQKKSGGMPLTHMLYCFIAILQMLLAGTPKSIYATGEPANTGKKEDDLNLASCEALIRYENFSYLAQGSYMLPSKTPAQHNWNIIFYGEDGELIVEPPLDKPGGKITLFNQEGHKSFTVDEQESPFQKQIDTLLMAILDPENIKNLRNPVSNDLKNVAIAELIEASHQSQTPIYYQQYVNEITYQHKKNKLSLLYSSSSLFKKEADKETEREAQTVETSNITFGCIPQGK